MTVETHLDRVLAHGLAILEAFGDVRLESHPLTIRRGYDRKGWIRAVAGTLREKMTIRESE
jgi:hypothetical protein